MKNNKTHIGSNGVPRCARGMSMHMIARRKPSVTVTVQEFINVKTECQCQKCAKSIDTADFSRGLSSFLGMK